VPNERQQQDTSKQVEEHYHETTRSQACDIAVMVKRQQLIWRSSSFGGTKFMERSGSYLSLTPRTHKDHTNYGSKLELR
jgi:hypothetical protein